jgi:hypothetical protein
MRSSIGPISGKPEIGRADETTTRVALQHANAEPLVMERKTARDAFAAPLGN